MTTPATTPDRAVGALPDAERLSRAVIDELQVGLLIQGPATEMLLANPAALRLLGLTEDQLLGRTSFDPTWNVIHEDGSPFPAVTHPVPRAVAERRPVRGVVMGVHRPLIGDRVWLLVDAIPALEPDGSVRQVVCTFADITARKRAEDALRASEEKFATAFQGSPNAVTLTRIRDRRYLEINEAGLAMTGYTREEVIGATADELRLLFDAEVRERVAATLLQGRDIAGEDLRFRKKSGEVFVGRYWARLVHLDGEPCLLSTVADLSEHRRAEEARGRAEAMLVAATMASPDLLILKDLDGRWLFANPAALAVHQKTLEEVLGRTDVAISADPEAARALMAMDQRVARTGVAETTELLVQAALGSRTFVSTKAPFRDRDGRLLGVVTSARDVTDEKRAQDEKARLELELQQARKMESVGRLAGGVAHDFNNMLGVILGNTDLALEQLEPDAAVRGELEEVRAAALRSADLTRQLLTFARKQPLAPKVIDLNDHVAAMLRLLERLIGENVRVAWKPGDALFPLRVDPSQIDQALTNLCVNARDAITGAGHVTIETGNAALRAPDRADASRDYVRLSVRDDGCGMDEATTARIFEPFFTTKDVGRGTGLGLATVYGIVKQNDGHIEVRSAPGQGTTFDLYFPRHHGAATLARAEAPGLAGAPGRETVLLVEDEPSLLRLTRRMLERMGHTVLPAASPAEALRLADGHPGAIHLLVTDVILPEMTGRELADALSGRHPGLKRLFLSGYAAAAIAPHGVLDERVCFLAKPFTQPALAAKVREGLDAG
jgi:PAS domain S-box-containing protein